MFFLNPRAPLYMGMITLSSALAVLTHPVIGVLTFAWMTMLYEGITQWLGRLLTKRQ
jgi:hypothetical protein